MCPEDTRADAATGPGSITVSTRARCPICRHPAHPSSSQTQVILVPPPKPVPYHRSCLQLQIGLQACTQGESPPFFPRERQIAKHFLFKLLLVPLRSGSRTISNTPTLCRAPCSSSNFLQLPGESLLQKGGRHQKISRFCFTLDFKAVKGEGEKKKKKEKARENQNRTKPKWFLLQPHAPEEKQRNASRNVPHFEQPLPSGLRDWLS